MALRRKSSSLDQLSCEKRILCSVNTHVRANALIPSSVRELRRAQTRYKPIRFVNNIEPGTSRSQTSSVRRYPTDRVFLL